MAASVSALNDVTNLPGYYCRSLYLVSSSLFVTNGGNVYWTNSYNLTNYLLWSAASPNRQPGMINGLDALSFTNDSAIMGEVGWVTNKQPYELVIVVNTLPSFAPANAGPAIQLKNTGVAYLGFWTTTNYLLFAGNYLASPDYSMIRNSWIVLDCIYNGAQSAIYTNNVLCVSGNAGNNECNGISVETLHFLSHLACLVHYTNNIPGTNATARGKVYTSLKNYFGL